MFGKQMFAGPGRSPWNKERTNGLTVPLPHPDIFSADISGDPSILGTDPLSIFFRQDKGEITRKLSGDF